MKFALASICLVAPLLAIGLTACSGGADAPTASGTNPGAPVPSPGTGPQPSPSPSPSPSPPPPATGSAAVPIVFVSRQILASGSIYYAPAKGMPGVGPFSRAAVAAPGRAPRHAVTRPTVVPRSWSAVGAVTAPSAR
ncbi:MAG: hypothetical protein N2688_06370 [Burkholderiaceae bacterium]|nr:hypothetical protein [Burkholderiaceae bacterium]